MPSDSSTDPQFLSPATTPSLQSNESCPLSIAGQQLLTAFNEAVDTGGPDVYTWRDSLGFSPYDLLRSLIGSLKRDVPPHEVPERPRLATSHTSARNGVFKDPMSSTGEVSGCGRDPNADDEKTSRGKAYLKERFHKALHHVLDGNPSETLDTLAEAIFHGSLEARTLGEEFETYCDGRRSIGREVPNSLDEMMKMHETDETKAKETFMADPEVDKAIKDWIEAKKSADPDYQPIYQHQFELVSASCTTLDRLDEWWKKKGRYTPEGYQVACLDMVDEKDNAWTSDEEDDEDDDGGEEPAEKGCKRLKGPSTVYIAPEFRPVQPTDG